MKNTAPVILGLAAGFCFCFSFKTISTKYSGNSTDLIQKENYNKIKNEKIMKLGAFSISLNVKDLTASKQFYENLGFKVFAGSMEKKYLIMKNENALVGLFHGMFQSNILTFNPGWDENATNIEKFDDVREIQQQLKNRGIKLTTEAAENTTGPAFLMLTDPDGNAILIDQHR